MSFFRVKQTRDKLGRRRWFWALVAANGETIAASETYTSEEGALRGIVAVKREAADAAIRFEP
jgi:uncharacterized protein YegP (UPF0339 family)